MSSQPASPSGSQTVNEIRSGSIGRLLDCTVRLSLLLTRLLLTSGCVRQRTISGVGCCHSSMDLYVPSILPPQVQVPSTPSMLPSIYWIVYCGKDENKQKEAGIGHFLKKLSVVGTQLEWVLLIKKVIKRTSLGSVITTIEHLPIDWLLGTIFCYYKSGKNVLEHCPSLQLPFEPKIR